MFFVRVDDARTTHSTAEVGDFDTVDVNNQDARIGIDACAPRFGCAGCAVDGYVMPTRRLAACQNGDVSVSVGGFFVQHKNYVGICGGGNRCQQYQNQELSHFPYLNEKSAAVFYYVVLMSTMQKYDK